VIDLVLFGILPYVAIVVAVVVSLWRYATNQFGVGPLASAGDYVSTGAEHAWTDAGLFADRCRAFRARGLSRKVLLYGPPGTGKSTLARHIADQIGVGRTLRCAPSVVVRTDAFSVACLLDFLRPEVLLLDDLDRDRGSAEQLLHMLESIEGLEMDVIVGEAAYSPNQMQAALSGITDLYKSMGGLLPPPPKEVLIGLAPIPEELKQLWLQVEVPSEDKISTNYKDLPLDAKLQVLERMGLSSNIMALAAKEVTDMKPDKRDELMGKDKKSNDKDSKKR